jgi:hypothetical protein
MTLNVLGAVRAAAETALWIAFEKLRRQYEHRHNTDDRTCGRTPVMRSRPSRGTSSVNSRSAKRMRWYMRLVSSS